MVKHLWLLVLLLALPLALADDAVFKVNEVADLKIPCINNDTYCSAVAICNITIINPDGSTFVEDAVMTNSGSYFNYTLNESDTSVVGVYRTQITCFDGTEAGYNLIEFKINNSGMEGLIADALVPAIILIALLVFCGFMAWKLPDEEYPIKFLFVGFAFVLMVLMVRFGYLVANDDLVGVAGLLNTTFYILLPIVTFLFIYFVVVKFAFGVLKTINKNYKDKRQGKDDE